jgi:hypothetical protein
MTRESVSISSLTPKKQTQLQSSISIPPMYISIEGHSFDPAIQATVYRLEIGVQKGDDAIVHSVSHRYSEIRNFHAEIRKQFGDSHYLLAIPPKKFIGNRDAQFLEIRAEQLQKYLANLAMIPGIARSPSFTKFFLVDESVMHDP